MEEKKASIGRLSVEVQEGRDILTREDTDKLFRLLAFYRPNDPHLKDNALRAVWALTLAPYSVDDVREAVVSYFRTQKYWPDPTDISSRCPQPETPKTQSLPTPTARYIDPAVESLRERWQDLRCQRRAAGVPDTWEETKKAGLPAAAWMDILDERGLAL